MPMEAAIAVPSSALRANDVVISWSPLEVFVRPFRWPGMRSGNRPGHRSGRPEDGPPSWTGRRRGKVDLDCPAPIVHGRVFAERFRAKWIPVRVEKTRQNKNPLAGLQ